MKDCVQWRIRAFTLIELLVVIAIIAVLIVIAFPVYNRFTQQSAQTATLSNMRVIGVAAMLYSGDNNFQLPNRVQNSSDPTQTPNKWPTLLKPYIQNVAIFASPIPDAQGKTYRVTDPTKFLSNATNYTSYIYNGFNDMGAFTDPTYIPRVNLVADTSSTILFGIPYPQTGQFYMDLVEGGGNNNEILNRTAFPTGSVYVFFDGSARMLKYSSTVNEAVQPVSSGVYSDWYWLIDKSNTAIIQPPKS